jgi:hypothetical protein
VAVDVAGRHEEGRRELVCLGLDLLDAPDLLAMQHEMREFVRGVEPGTGTVILVGAQDHNRVVGEG